MQLIYFLYEDFILWAATLGLLALCLRTLFKFGFISRLLGIALWSAILACCLAWIHYHYHSVSPEKNYRDLDPAQIPDLAAIATQKKRYVGVTYDGRLDLDQLRPHINSSTPPNALKWRSLLKNRQLGHYDFSTADRLVNELLEANIAVRGHTLIWGKWPSRTHPADLKQDVMSSPDPAAQLKYRMEEHISAVMKHFEGRIQRWDVVNEPLSMSNKGMDDSLFYRVLGEEYIAEAFRIARRVSPTATLFINEDFRNYSTENTEKFLSMIRQLLENDVPIDGIGIQSHHLYNLKNIGNFRRFAKNIIDLGLVFEITELDVPLWFFESHSNPFEAQRNYYYEYTSVCFENPNCLGVTTWGAYDDESWLDHTFPFSLRRPNQPLLLDSDMRKKPVYQALVEALQQAHTRD